MQGSGGNIPSDEIAILDGQMSFHQDPIQIYQWKVDYVPSPRPPKEKADIKVEKEAPVNLINMELNNKIRENEKVVQPFNMNFNRVISY